MKYDLKVEEQIIEDTLSFAYDPAGFSLYAYPWGEPGTMLEDVAKPRTWQYNLFEELRDHTKRMGIIKEVGEKDKLQVFQECIASGRGIGKSAGLGIICDWHLSCHLGATAMLLANTESQLRSKTFPEFAKWFNMGINSHWFNCEGFQITPQPWLVDIVQKRIDCSKWKAYGQNWNENHPDALAGEHNPLGLLIIYDEASGIPECIWSTTKGFLTEKNPFRYWFAFSNPRRNSGAFHSRFHDPKQQKYWRTRQIDARTVEDVDMDVYQEIIDTYGETSDEARIEVYGQFPELGEGQLIANSVVDGARDRFISYAMANDDPIILGCDPAPGANGRTVIRIRQGRDAQTFPVTEMIGAGNRKIAEKIVELAGQFDADGIVIDGGNGHGVASYLKDMGIRFHEVHFANSSTDTNGEFFNMAGELWGKLRDWLAYGSIDRSDELRRDLTARTWRWHGGKEDGKKLLTPKREMARDGIPSPDDADALALTFYPRLPKRSSKLRTARGRARNKNRGRIKWDFA